MPVLITYVVGDATHPQVQNSQPIVIPHIVNSVGQWGSGFVMALHKRWPQLRQKYIQWYEKGWNTLPFALGQTQFLEAEPDITVANMCAQKGIGPGKDGPPIRYDAVRECLQAVTKYCQDKGAEVHMPFFGCGLSGGKWEEIEKIVQDTLIEGNVPVTVYDYSGEFQTLTQK